MKYKLFGRTGLKVSDICLGAMSFGTEWGFGGDKEACREVYNAFVDAGGNFIDTANRYTEGTSELFLGDFMQGMRDSIVLATKYTLYNQKGDLNNAGNSRKNMFRTVEGSLKRLQTDYIDILYLHVWDFTTPVEEVMRGLDDLVRAGKVLYVAVSDTPAWIVSQANTIADFRGWSAFAGFQAEYNLLKRDVERDILPMANQLDLALTAWGPLAGGALSGKYLDNNDSTLRLKEGSVRLNDRSVIITKEVVKIANELGCTPAQVALNWLKQQKKVVIPIVGARKKEQIEDNLGASNFEIPDELLNRLNEISKIDLGFPHDFLDGDVVSQLAFGGMKEQLINHRR